MNSIKISLLIAALLGIFSIATPAAASSPCGDTVRVVRGDSLSKIARRCGTQISPLLLANPRIKNANLIYPGTELQIPQKAIRAHFGQDSSPTIVIRPEADRLSLAQIEELGISEGSQERWIDVDLSSQTVSAYRGKMVVRTFLASTGLRRTPTVTGQYEIISKFRLDDMKGPGYNLKDVPFTMYFHRSYALHGTYWHSNFGTPMSHGCVNLSEEDSAWLFDYASVGTLVNVHN